MPFKGDILETPDGIYRVVIGVYDGKVGFMQLGDEVMHTVTLAEWDALESTRLKEEPVTGQQMCEAIVEAGLMLKADGTPRTPKEVWEYSPTGELYMVYAMYDVAKRILRNRKAQNTTKET